MVSLLYDTDLVSVNTFDTDLVYILYMSENTIKFPERLKELRQEKGLSQRALAKVLHVTQPAIVRWETGQQTPNLEMLVTISKFFNVSLDYLVGTDDII